MSYPPPPPPVNFLPPAAPRRKSRAGGVLLLFAGIAAAVSPWLPLISFRGQSATLQQASEAGGIDSIDSPKLWFYAVLAGAGIAIVFGLIGLAGNKGANITAGIFGLVATAAMSTPASRVIEATGFAELDEIVKVLSAGYYTLSGASLLALIGSITAFVGSRKR